MTEQDNRPVAYAAEALSKQKENYAMIDKEAKEIIFGVTKVYDYF